MPGILLPLFPLNVVLFPRSSLPLHIFEERYRILAGECIARGTGFGINLTREQGMAPVGCVARIAGVIRRYEDGRLDIAVEGGERYRVLAEDSTRAPYLVGEIEILPDDNEEFDRPLAEETAKLYHALLQAIRGGEQEPLEKDRLTYGVSYVIAQKAGMELADRQMLLEMTNENRRLARLRDHLRDLLPRLQHIEELTRVARNDGYL